jgi:hypothetical protein
MRRNHRRPSLAQIAQLLLTVRPLFDGYNTSTWYKTSLVTTNPNLLHSIPRHPAGNPLCLYRPRDLICTTTPKSPSICAWLRARWRGGVRWGRDRTTGELHLQVRPGVGGRVLLLSSSERSHLCRQRRPLLLLQFSGGMGPRGSRSVACGGRRSQAGTSRNAVCRALSSSLVAPILCYFF